MIVTEMFIGSILTQFIGEIKETQGDGSIFLVMFSFEKKMNLPHFILKF